MIKIPYVSPATIELDLDRPQRVALIGLGEAAEHIHLPASRLLPKVQLVAAVDPRAERRAWFRSVASRAETFAEVPEMLARVQPDWVVLATPPNTHQALCLLALEAGAHVFCEKPFVEDARDAIPILEKERSSGRRVVVNYEFPQMRIFRAGLELAHSADFGPVLFVQFWENVWEEPGSMQGWRAQHLTLREFGTHVLDLAMRVYGEAPKSVFAQTDSPRGPAGTDLVDVVSLTFPSGRLASIVLNRVCRGPHRYLEMRMDGGGGSFRASFGSRLGVKVGVNLRKKSATFGLDATAGGMAWLETGDRRVVLAREPINPFAEATARHLGAAMVAVAQGRTPVGASEEALGPLRLVEAAYESARLGAPVAFTA